MLKPRAVILGAFLVVVLPLWIGLAWALGLIRVGEEPVMTRRPVFEQTTARSSDALSFCLAKDYAGRLSLSRANSPRQPPQTVRLRNRTLHLVVDVSPNGVSGSIVRVFKLNDASFAHVHQLAIQSCIPENGFPAAADPRNRDFYSGGN